MGDDAKRTIGEIAWTDLTVENAEQIRDFYREVVGWSSDPVAMKEYDDFNMKCPDAGNTVAGICHARGSNANLPPQWLIYINVADVDKSIQRCVELGGQVIDGPRSAGGGRFCVIRDPAGQRRELSCFVRVF